jgi:hypothetical protein
MAKNVCQSVYTSEINRTQATRPFRFDAVVLDYRMPKMERMEVAKHILEVSHLTSE